MVYGRPTGIHRPAVRVAAGMLLIAMLVLGFLGYPPKITAQTVQMHDATGLPALDGTNGTGRSAPVPLDVQLDGSFPVSVSLSPTLVWRNVPGTVGQARFEITTLAEKDPKVLWSRTVPVGADRVAKADVPLGMIEQGRTYAWNAVSSTNPAVNNHGPHAITVDVQRSGSQPVFTAGNLAITEGTGELVYTYQGPSLNALAGPIGWTLVHRPTNTPQPGLPAGWRLVVSGSTGWDALRQNDDGSVTLSTATGVSVTYVKRGQNQWEPQLGGFNTAGEATLLAQSDDGTFSATDGNRTVTVFSKPTQNASGHPLRIWSLDSPAAQQTWVDGRLRGLIDPVTDNSIALLYSEADGCTSTVDPGFVKAPEGMLCGTVDATGNVVMFEYVKVGKQVQIGRTVSGLGAGIYASSSDIGWDDSGRIVETRNPLAAAAGASVVVADLGPQDPRVLTQIAYDANGHVASLTAPAGLIAGKEQPAIREVRPKTLFTYAPFTVRTAGVTTPSGFDMRDVLDPVTLRVERKIDDSGNAMTFAYDAGGNVTRVVGLSTGTQTTTRYNHYGKPVEQIGPTKGALTSPTAPRTTTDYDQDAQGHDWKGLAVRYWANAGFNGAPASGSTGPVVGGSVVSNLQFNWPSSPAGTSGPWSARLSGVYEAPAAGSYRFDTQTSAKLWVNGRLCAPSCSATLGAMAAASLQVDVVSADGAAAGVKVMVTGPDGKQVAVPTAQLRPNYGLATSSTVRENDGAGMRTLVTKMVYDPVTTQLLKTISPSGATISRTYEPYDPANGQWGRSTSVTDASGKTTTSSYYAKDAVATDCSGQTIDQSGATKSVTLPGESSVAQVVGPDGGALTATDGASTSCATSSNENLVFKEETKGLGADAKSYSLPMAEGNPLVSMSITVAGGETKFDGVALDTNGNAWKTIDAQGTTTIRQWDALRGYLDHVIEVTKDGTRRTTDYTYARDGQVATVTVNGHLLATNVYTADGTLVRTELGNGAVQTFELDQNNNAKRNTTRFPDGTTLSESMVRSPSGRLLSRTIAGPSGTSTYTYDYNADGRLIDTKLVGTIPVQETRWQNAYTGPDGSNGNRASKTTTRADGSATTTTFAYGADNRLLSEAGERFAGSFAYDAAGRATKMGDVGLTYDAAGHLLTANDANRQYTFSDAGATTTLTRTSGGEQTTLTATSSGESLILGADGKLDGQLVTPVAGVKVVLDGTGAPARWVYDDAIGNGTWTSRGNAAPTKAHLYSPDGEPVSVVRTSDPKTPLDLVLDGLGWQSGRGASTLRLAAPITILGDRSYTPDGGRWLQADPTVGGSMNAYEYAIGDAINLSDPTGNAPSTGAIIGMVAAAVVGIAIGSLTFGIGTAAVASYGIGAFAAQVAVGAVVGLASGAVGEVVQQVIDNGGVTDWAKIGIAAGFGAASGAAFAGLSAIVLKVLAPGKMVRALGIDLAEGKTIRGYAGLRSQFKNANVESSRGMFTKGSWKKDFAKMKGWEGSDYEGMSFKNILKQELPVRGANGGVTSGDRLVDDVFGGRLNFQRPSGSGRLTGQSGLLQQSQQKTLSDAAKFIDPGSNNAKTLSKKLASDEFKADKILDRFSKGQHNSYVSQKSASGSIDLDSVTSVDLAQQQYLKYILSLGK